MVPVASGVGSWLSVVSCRLSVGVALRWISGDSCPASLRGWEGLGWMEEDLAGVWLGDLVGF